MAYPDQTNTAAKTLERVSLLGLLLIVVTAVAYLPAWNGKPIWDEAISYLRKAIEKSPGHAQARLNLGNALLQNGEVDSAIAEYEKTLEFPSDHAESTSLSESLRSKLALFQSNLPYHEASPAGQ